MHLHFICSGTVGVYDYRVGENLGALIDKVGGSRKGSADIGEGKSDFDKLSDQIDNMIQINQYVAGQSFGDPFIDFRTPLSSKVVVTSDELRVVSISREAYLHVQASKINKIIEERGRLLFDNFMVFKTWSE